MRKPDNIVYWQNERPPARFAAALALQQAAFLGALLALPSLFAHHHGLPYEQFLNIAAATLLVTAVGVVLQVLQRGGIGSGYYYPMQATSAVLPAMYLASDVGGLALSFGMVAVIGVSQIAFSYVLPRLRSVFTVEIAGLAVMLLGIGLGQMGVHLIFEGEQQSRISPADIAVAGITFFTMVFCNVWIKSRARMFATLIGLGIGALAAWLLGLIDATDGAQLGAAPWFRLPELGLGGWAFEPALILPYVITGFFLAVGSLGTQTMAQQANDAEWRRADLHAFGRGLRAEGCTQLVAALLHGLPLASSGGAVSQAAASGSTSRHLGYWLAGVLVLFALLPKLMLVWLVLPEAVIGGLLLFLSAFTMLSGVQMVGSRLLDNRRVLAVGTGLAVALSFPALHGGLAQLWPLGAEQVVFSAFAGGLLTAVLLTALFRLGVKRRTMQTFDIAHTTMEEVTRFIERQGALWGARREVVQRAQLAAWQAFDLLAQGGFVQAQPALIRLRTLHDEFSLSISFQYEGRAPVLSPTPPGHDELLEDPHAEARLAGYLINRLARAKVRQSGKLCSLHLGFAD
ncbi:xanthine/uracil permease [Verticiella sediminum]|uniref:Xanthine/uracil permease n=1 Tax=Verticiella sediminum TaxID=1247510 RepID=A0A556AVW4_9BURK|nr:solute carrier family 23 protein [Verticiella sediminum]TSH97050.1 xanthine/uracil permease [Verticiella sediminum]